MSSQNATLLILLESSDEDDGDKERFQDEESALIVIDSDDDDGADSDDEDGADSDDEEEQLIRARVRAAVERGDAAAATRIVRQCGSRDEAFALLAAVYKELSDGEDRRQGAAPGWRAAIESVLWAAGGRDELAGVVYTRLCQYGGSGEAWSALGELCAGAGKTRLAARALGRAERAALDWQQQRRYIERRRQLYVDQGRVADADALQMLLGRLDERRWTKQAPAPVRLRKAYAELRRRKGGRK